MSKPDIDKEHHFGPLDDGKELSLDEIPEFIMSVVHSRPNVDMNVVEALFIRKLSAVTVVDVERLQMTGLHGACHINNLNLVKLFVEHGTDVNVVTTALQTPLHCALLSNLKEMDINIVVYLLNHGADIYAEDNNKKAPIHFLLMHREINMLNIRAYLESHGAIQPLENTYKCTPLHRAVDKSLVSDVRTLLQHPRYNINALTNEDKTPLMLAASNGSLEIVELLIANGADPNIISESDMSPLMYAASKGYIEVVKLLVANGADPNRAKKHDKMAVHHSIFPGNGEVFKYLLERTNYEKIIKRNKMYYDIIKSRSMDCMDVLLESDYCKELIEKKVCNLEEADIPHRKYKKLCIVGTLSRNHFLYSIENFEKMLGKMVKCGFPVNNEFEECFPPLSILTVVFSKKSESYVEKLIHYGANINYPDPEAPEALLCLLNCSDTDIFLFFLQHADFATPESVLKGYIRENDVSKIAPKVVHLFLTLGMTPSSVRLLSTYSRQAEVADYNELTGNVCQLQQLCRIALRNLFYLKCSSLSINEIMKKLKLATSICQYLKYERN